MTATSLLLFILFIQLVHFLGTWKLYVAAGRKAWEAAIPVYNGIVLMKIINRPTWWIFFLFVPVINLFLFPIIWIETLRTFGKKTTADMVLGVATLGLYIAYVNYTQKVEYHADRELKAPNKTMDTIGSLSFAIMVATLVHTYFIQPYTIPTSSLEKSLLVGDFLFVSKFHYGARTPMTPIAAPMVHDTLPLINVKSYSKKPQLPYFRFPKIQEIKNNDIVVFNWPTDTVRFFRDPNSIDIRKPIDKKSNYVKRCLGIPGDSLQIKNGVVYINNKPLEIKDRQKTQRFYTLNTKQGQYLGSIVEDYKITEYRQLYEMQTALWENDLVKNYFKENPKFELIEYAKDSLKTTLVGNINQATFDKFKMGTSATILNINATEELIAKMKTDSRIEVIKNYLDLPSTALFPHSKPTWSTDNFGPIYIPQEGKTVAINAKTLPFYKMIITEYEGNTVEENGNEIKINGDVATTYTFKQDYYWMMGDNRHNSEDSRYWGYVPANHIVGKPIFIWMSIDGINDGITKWKPRWERFFTTVDGQGQPQSYFKYFLILLGLYYVGDYFWKKKKKANSEE
jgi:signal peptidase I